MPRHEIVAQFTCDVTASTPEEAAAIVSRHLATLSAGQVDISRLAAWRQDGAPTTSPLPAGLRKQLDAFFSGVEQHADVEEAAFRGRVEAIFDQTSDGAGTP